MKTGLISFNIILKEILTDLSKVNGQFNDTSQIKTGFDSFERQSKGNPKNNSKKYEQTINSWLSTGYPKEYPKNIPKKY